MSQERYGIRRFALLNTAGYSLGLFPLEHTLSVYGANNLGKSASINALQFPILARMSDMSFGKYSLEQSRKFYFASDTSYILVEVMLPHGPHVIGVAGRGPGGGHAATATTGSGEALDTASLNQLLLSSLDELQHAPAGAPGRECPEPFAGLGPWRATPAEYNAGCCARLRPRCRAARCGRGTAGLAGVPVYPLLETPLFISSAFAQAAAPAAGGGDMMSSLGSMLPLVLMFVVLYFVMIRPQMKRQKEARAMIEALAKGDEVATAGGVLGRITSLGVAPSTVV